MEEIIRAIKENDELQEAVANGFKESPRDLMKIWSDISGLPKIREIVLTDEDFISQRLSGSYRFFDGLPKDFGYLISLYDVSEKPDYASLMHLYQKYFGDELSDDEINEIILAQLEITSEPNVYMLSTKDRMEDITYLLKHISSNKDFYKNMKALGDKYDLDYRALLSFTRKYGDTELYSELLAYEQPSNSVVEKISYLAGEGKIEDIQSLADIEDTSMEELHKREKQKSEKVFTNLRGGPRSKTRCSIFPSCDSREVRRINPDGTFKLFPMDEFGMNCPHEMGVVCLYEDSYEFLDEDATALEKSIEVAKHLGAVTFIIENEQCFIVLPNDITEQQKHICKRWIDSAIEIGEFGLFVYDREKYEFFVPNEETMNATQTLEYIMSIKDKRQAGFPDIAVLTQDVCLFDFNRTQKEISDGIEPEDPKDK